MVGLRALFVLATAATGILAEQWPCNRVHQVPGSPNRRFRSNASQPEVPFAPENEFIKWLRAIVANDQGGKLSSVFTNGSIPDNINHIADLLRHLNLPDSDSLPQPAYDPTHQQPLRGDIAEAQSLLAYLKFPVNLLCITSKD